MALIGKRAPKIKAAAVINGGEIVQRFTLEQYFGKKNVILFFYPKDFSSLCPTEILAFQENLAAFEKKNTTIIGCSTDTAEAHRAWLHTPVESGGIRGVTFPLIADTSRIISLNYGVLAGEYSFDNEKKLWSFNGVPTPLRATFLIDRDGIVRHQSVNDFAMGRNAGEYLRVLDTLIMAEEIEDLCHPDEDDDLKAIVDNPAPNTRFNYQN